MDLAFIVGVLAIASVASIAKAGDQAALHRTHGRADAYRVADSHDAQRRQRELHADFERKRAEQLRKFEQKKREIKAEHDRLAAEMKREREAAREKPAADSSAASSPATELPFDRSAAPSPEDGWRAFVAATLRATSMEEVLPYLPEQQQQVLHARQAQFNPAQAAKNAQWLREHNSRITDDSLAFHANSPFANELKFYKDIAKMYIAILRVRTEGNKSHLTVSTHGGAVVNARDYPYSTAQVYLVGEGSSWRFARYSDSGIVYMKPPEHP